jgi:hypothetical protein
MEMDAIAEKNVTKIADLLNRYGAYAAPAAAGYSLLSGENNK